VFSSEKTPTLHCAVPALEALHKAWSSRAECSKYERFAPALEATCTKIDEYYEKTTESPAYIMAMSMCSKLLVLSILLLIYVPVLDLKEKMAYFKEHWSINLQGKVIKCVEEVV
jgi:hypothetical protein